MKFYNHDFVIVGTGLAGLHAAIHAAQHGSVAIICKTEPKESNSYQAQGGVAAAFDPEDTIQDHFQDTIIAGRGLCDEKAVQILVSEGKQRVQELINMGMRFDGESLGREGGHGKRRVLHVDGGFTGKAIIELLIYKAKQNPNIKFYTDSYINKIFINGGIASGVVGYNLKTTENFKITGRTILASGGGSGIYKRTTNPYGATADGVSLAYNAGAEIADMEFMQFHPTAFYGDDSTFLISEAVRGEGTLLLNENGERFMQYLHELKELAPRDIVARAIFNELQNSKGDRVFLQFDQRKKEILENRFNNIFSHVRKYGINPPEELLPVAPAAHYMVGGIKTNYNAESSVKGLFACGEVASSGVHGANRLASNSLLECLVFSYRAVKGSLKYKPFATMEDHNKMIRDEENKPQYVNDRINLGRILTENVGIIRSEKRLKFALEQINDLRNKIDKNKFEYYNHRLSSVLTTAELIARSALQRKGSRGGHYREDFPEKNDDMNFHIYQKINQNPLEILHYEEI